MKTVHFNFLAKRKIYKHAPNFNGQLFVLLLFIFGTHIPHTLLGSLPGAMNSWFLYEFTVYSMGSISANIMNYLGKFD